MNYNKEDAQMTRGLAIICMLVLHLFCRQGGDVYGTPLLWINETIPVVYLFGFFAEICVPLYSICTGYAQELLRETGKNDFRSRGVRIFRLMVNYWIILGLFSVLALVADPNGAMPGSLTDFLKSIVLLHSYNGAWWYLNTYMLLLFLPPRVLLFPVGRMKLTTGLLFCGTVHLLWYLLDRFAILPSVPETMPVLAFVWTEISSLIGILAYVWAGAFLCRYQVVNRLSSLFESKVSPRWQKWILLMLAAVLFVVTNMVHKWVAMGPVALTVFLLFNLWRKSDVTQKIWLFLGKHSTNIWLTHMFFYAYVFEGLVFAVKYPILMFAFLLALCIATSNVVMLLNRGLGKLCEICGQNGNIVLR